MAKIENKDNLEFYLTHYVSRLIESSSYLPLDFFTQFSDITLINDSFFSENDLRGISPIIGDPVDSVYFRGFEYSKPISERKIKDLEEVGEIVRFKEHHLISWDIGLYLGPRGEIIIDNIDNPKDFKNIIQGGVGGFDFNKKVKHFIDKELIDIYVTHYIERPVIAGKIVPLGFHTKLINRFSSDILDCFLFKSSISVKEYDTLEVIRKNSSYYTCFDFSHPDGLSIYIMESGGDITRLKKPQIIHQNELLYLAPNGDIIIEDFKGPKDFSRVIDNLSLDYKI